MLNTFDITESGYPVYDYKYPNGCYRSFSYKGYHGCWKSYNKVYTRTLNLVNVESFEELEFPILEKIVFTERPKSIFKKLLFGSSYDVDFKISSIKKVTCVKMRSGKIYMIDESAECLKNALDSCVWTAEFLKSIEER